MDNPAMNEGGGDQIVIVNRRRMAAAPEALFEAFANPELLVRWWGPNGFTNTIQEFDFRPGGAWRINMRSPEGAEFDNESQFVEIDRPHAIVFEHLRPMHWFRMTMRFETMPDGTEVTWRMVLAADEHSRKLQAFLEGANEQNLDRLESLTKSP